MKATIKQSKPIGAINGAMKATTASNTTAMLAENDEAKVST